MSDLVVNVKQISNYPARTQSDGTENLLIQVNGLGGPYNHTRADILVATALEHSKLPLAVGVTPPADAGCCQIFTDNLSLPNGGQVRWNAYYDAGGVLRYQNSGPAGALGQDQSGTLDFLIYPPGQADQPASNARTGFTIDANGCMAIPLCTLTVGRDAAGPMEVLTLQQYDTKTQQALDNLTQAIHAWVQGAYMPVTGGSFTGPVAMWSNATQPLEPVTLQQLQTILDALPTGGEGDVSFIADEPITVPAGETVPNGVWMVTSPDADPPISSTINWQETDPTQLIASDGANITAITDLTLYRVEGLGSAGGGGTGGAGDLTGYLHLSGGAMSGPLLLYADATQPLQAVPYQQVESMIAAINTDLLDFVHRSGDQMTGYLKVLNPVDPNDATPKFWVENEVASLRRYMGVWKVAANVPDISPGHDSNGDYYIAITANPTLQETPPIAIPGLTGLLINNGDEIFWNDDAQRWEVVRGGPLNLVEADALFVSKTGDVMTGPLTLAVDATSAMMPVTLHQLTDATSALVSPEMLTNTLANYLNRSGGQMQGTLTLAHNAANPLEPVTLQQVQALIAAGGGGGEGGLDPVLFLQKSGGTMTGPIVLPGNATNPLAAVPLQQVNTLIDSALTGSGYLRLVGGTMTGPLILSGSATNPLGAVTLQQMNDALGATFPGGIGVTQIIAGTGLTGGTIMTTGTIALAVPVTVANGGTGATSAAQARTNLGAGTGNGTVTSVAAGTGLTGGTITAAGTIALATPVSIANGGTGATSATAAMNNLGGATVAQLGNYLPIAGGTITGSLNVNGTIQGMSGRVIARAGGGNPGFTCWDTNQNAATIMFFGGGGVLYWGAADGSGNYVGPVFASLDRGGSFNAAGNMACNQLTVRAGASIAFPWGHSFGFDWDGSFTRVLVDNSLWLQLAHVGWVNQRISDVQNWVMGQALGSLTAHTLYCTWFRASSADGSGQIHCMNQLDMTNQSIMGAWDVHAAGAFYGILYGYQFPPSDQTLKHDIQPIRQGLPELMRLRPVNFIISETNTPDIGFIADEIEEVLPEAVHEFSGKKGYNPASVLSVAVKAIQQLAERVDELERRTIH